MALWKTGSQKEQLADCLNQVFSDELSSSVAGNIVDWLLNANL